MSPSRPQMHTSSARRLKLENLWRQHLVSCAGFELEEVFKHYGVLEASGPGAAFGYVAGCCVLAPCSVTLAEAPVTLLCRPVLCGVESQDSRQLSNWGQPQK